MLGAAEGGKLGLEGAHLRPENELAMIENARDRRIDGPPSRRRWAATSMNGIDGRSVRRFIKTSGI